MSFGEYKSFVRDRGEGPQEAWSDYHTYLELQALKQVAVMRSCPLWTLPLINGGPSRPPSHLLTCIQRTILSIIIHPGGSHNIIIHKIYSSCFELSIHLSFTFQISTFSSLHKIQYFICTPFPSSISTTSHTPFLKKKFPHQTLNSI